MKYLIPFILVSSLTAQEDLLIGLAVMDVVTTNYILSTGGVELNPLLVVVADDLFALGAIKGIIVFGFLKTNPSKLQLWVLNIVASTAVINNLWQIRKHHRRIS